MNFLLHRHLATAAFGSEVAGVGAMLPDLWRMSDRRVRAAGELGAIAEEPLADLLEGVDHHLASDARFHKADLFLRGERAVAEVLKTLRAARARLFAHIAWELCLDGELVRREGLETILASLRRGFVGAGSSLSSAAGVHHFDRVERDAAERETFEDRMRRIVTELERGPWIAGYANGDGIGERLSGVRMRLGLEAFDADDRVRLADGLDALEAMAAEAVDELFADPAYFQATRRAANRSARCS